MNITLKWKNSCHMLVWNINSTFEYASFKACNNASHLSLLHMKTFWLDNGNTWEGYLLWHGNPHMRRISPQQFVVAVFHNMLWLGVYTNYMFNGFDLRTCWLFLSSYCMFYTLCNNDTVKSLLWLIYDIVRLLLQRHQHIRSTLLFETEVEPLL